jgi:hypothetical protein
MDRTFNNNIFQARRGENAFCLEKENPHCGHVAKREEDVTAFYIKWTQLLNGRAQTV